jgi:hypothetical protein
MTLAIFPRRVTMAVVLALAALLWTAQTAEAKILPVASLEVVTSKPTAGRPFEVVMRFGRGFDLPDAQWEDFEVSVVSADRTDARGWPLDRSFHGTSIPLRRSSKGVYHGSAVVDRPGDYVVLAWSSVYAHEDRVQGVVTRGDYAKPVRLRISGVSPGVASTATRSARRTSSAALVEWSVVAALVAICAGVALWAARARSRRRIALASAPNE